MLIFVQRSPTECGVSECDRKASIMRALAHWVLLRHDRRNAIIITNSDYFPLQYFPRQFVLTVKTVKCEEELDLLTLVTEILLHQTAKLLSPCMISTYFKRCVCVDVHVLNLASIMFYLHRNICRVQQ